MRGAGSLADEEAQGGEVRGAGTLADEEVEVSRCDAGITNMIAGMPTMSTTATGPEVREKERVTWLAW